MSMDFSMDERFELADITNNPRKRKKNEVEWEEKVVKESWFFV